MSEELKRYELNIADLLQIPEESFDNFLIDLKKWHRAARSTLNLLNTLAEATGEKDVPPAVTKMVWIDDGKHDGKIIIKAAPTDMNTEEERS